MNPVRVAAFTIALAFLMTACSAKTIAPKITATKTITTTLKGVGTLTTRLEIHQANMEATATAWLTWSGEYEVAATATVNLYRWDTSAPKPLVTNDKDFDLKAGQDGTLATPTVTESRRLCASVNLSLEGYDADANTVSKPEYASTCERS
jgi:hypothetical protein